MGSQRNVLYYDTRHYDHKAGDFIYGTKSGQDFSMSQCLFMWYLRIK